MIIEKAYGKVNLALEIVGKREDGYHELKSIMVPVDIYDELYFEESDKIELISELKIEDNIILKAAKLLKETFNVNKGARITLVKRIPVAAGMAGGSADCSATLRGLAKLWKIDTTIDELAQLSAKLGSDTIYCVYNVPSAVFGRGEIVKPLNANLKANVIIINPRFPVSTKEIFMNHKIVKHEENDFNKLVESFYTDNVDNVNKNIYNDLEKTTFNLYPRLEELSKRISAYLPNIMMSGSGPTLFALTNDLPLLENVKKLFENECLIIISSLK